MAHPNTIVQRFYARGKLLLSGEYLVLDGAQAFAVPCALGQSLDVQFTDHTDNLHWQSFDVQGKLWFEANFKRKDLKASIPAVAKTPHDRVARLLTHVLHEHPRVWPRGEGLHLVTRLEFDQTWGLGSSATLSYLLATWAACNPYLLNDREFGGSGYDIATAGANGPILYRVLSDRPRVEPIAWHPAFIDQLYLVHLGQKQDSRASIADFRASSDFVPGKFTAEVDAITLALRTATTLADFSDAMRKHEALVGYVTHQVPVQKARFPDLPGTIKSLGGWGGDFALVASEAPPEQLGAYFADHSLSILVPAKELLLTNSDAIPVRPVLARPGNTLVFLYGALAEPRADNEWLTGHRYWHADLLDYGVDLVAIKSSPFPSAGRLVPGTLVELSTDEIQALDLHPQGAGFRRTQVTVRTQQGDVLAQAWLTFA